MPCPLRSLALTLLALATSGVLRAQSNLLVNGDAEAGSLLGWTDALGHGFNVATGAAAYAGAYGFTPGLVGPSGAWSSELRQDVGLAGLATAIDAGGVTSVFGGFGRTNSAGGATDPGRVIVEFRSATGTVLTSFDSGTIQPFNAWVPLADLRAVPVGTRTVRVRLLGSRSVGASTDCFFDELSLHTTPGAGTYCTSGTTSNGCVASIGASGAPTAGASSGFVISVQGVEGAQSGLIFYGLSGAAAAPWGLGSSFQCVKSPIERGPVGNAGGTAGACDGLLLFDWSQFVATHPSALGVPFGGGETVWAQGWFRDPPAPKTTNLSDGLVFVVNP